MNFPEDLRYTEEHEWTRIRGDMVTVGVTAFAVEQLGDITMVDLPSAGDSVTAGEACGVIESVKSVSDLYAPVSGEVVAVNGDLQDRPELINESPYDAGWLFQVRFDPGTLDALLDVAAYKQLVAAAAAE